MVPIYDVHPARVLTRVQARPSRRLTSPQGRIVSEAARNCACVMITNFSDEALTVPKATVLGVAEEMSESVVDRINTVGQSSVNTSKNIELYRKLLKGKLEHLPPHERQLIEPVFVRYAHVFHDEEPNDFKATNVVEYEIPVEDSIPIRRPLIRRHSRLGTRWTPKLRKCCDKGLYGKRLPLVSSSHLGPKEELRWEA